MTTHAGPKRTWTIRAGTMACDARRLGMYSWRRWEYSDGCLGSMGGTPWTAWWNWRQWRAEYRNAPPGTFADREAP